MQVTSAVRGRSNSATMARAESPCVAPVVSVEGSDTVL